MLLLRVVSKNWPMQKLSDPFPQDLLQDLLLIFSLVPTDPIASVLKSRMLGYLSSSAPPLCWNRCADTTIAPIRRHYSFLGEEHTDFLWCLFEAALPDLI